MRQKSCPIYNRNNFPIGWYQLYSRKIQKAQLKHISSKCVSCIITYKLTGTKLTLCLSYHPPEHVIKSVQRQSTYRQVDYTVIMITTARCTLLTSDYRRFIIENNYNEWWCSMMKITHRKCYDQEFKMLTSLVKVFMTMKTTLYLHGRFWLTISQFQHPLKEDQVQVWNYDLRNLMANHRFNLKGTCVTLRIKPLKISSNRE